MRAIPAICSNIIFLAKLTPHSDKKEQNTTTSEKG
jgi:hypothetical protein